MFSSKESPAIVIATSLILAMMLILTGCGSGPDRGAAGSQGPTVTPLVIQIPTLAPATVTPATLITRVTSRSVANSVKATGTLLSAKQAALAFAVTGRVKLINVEEGAKVKAGLVMAQLDTGGLEATVGQAQAAYDLAKAGFLLVQAGPNKDQVALAKANLGIAKAAVDQAQAAYDRIGGSSNPFSGISPQGLALQQATNAFQAATAQYNLAVNHPTDTELAIAGAQFAQSQAALDAAKTSLANASIVAPFDGTVLAINPKVGESVAANTVVMTLADLKSMQAVVNLDENSLTGVKVGQPVVVTVDAIGGRTLTGKVRKIGLLGTAATGVVSVPVTMDIDSTDAPIYPGLSATVEFQVGQ